LRKALERARDAFIEVLEGYTLSDLVKPRARLHAMLSIETVKPVRAHAGTRRRGREQGRRVLSAGLSC